LQGTTRAKVIEVDFAARQRVLAPRETSVARRPLAALQALSRSSTFLIFWRPRMRRTSGEYLGGRWDWGWTLFVWTSDAAVGSVKNDLVKGRGYLPERLTRDGFLTFLRRAADVGGLLLDGELDGDGHVIHAEPDQLIRRTDALSLLGR